MTSASPREFGALVERAAQLCDHDAALPTIIGIAGQPGVGKSTLVALLASALRDRGLTVVIVPMDGFHLSRRAVTELGRRERRGAPDTFDADGYLEILRRIAGVRDTGRTVWAPTFEREVHDPVAADIPVGPQVDLVLTEGNYLLLQQEPWHLVPGVLDEIWYLQADDEAKRLARLMARHERFGRTPQEAKAHAEGSDEANARLVARTAHRADLIVHWQSGSEEQ